MKYGYLDSLRALAILLVLFSHVHFTGIDVPAWWQNGAIGVSLFFIVSSYTICLSQEKSNQDWSTFFQKRFFRIYPMFFLVVTSVYILHFFWSIFSSVGENINPYLNYFLHLGFLYGFWPSGINSFHLGEWSLFSEAWFYLLFPFFWKITKNSLKNSIFLVIFLAFVSTIWHYFMDSAPIGKNFHEWWLFVYYFPLRHLVSFGIGIIIFHIHKLAGNSIRPNKLEKNSIENKNFSNKDKTNNFFSLKNFEKLIFENKKNLKYILFFVSFFWSLYLVFIWTSGKSISFFHTNFYFFFLVLSFMALNIKSNFLEYIGKISYSLYLLNLPIIFIAGNFIARYNLDKTLVTILAFLVLFLMANQTYKIEMRGISLRNKFKDHKFGAKKIRENKIDNFGL